MYGEWPEGCDCRCNNFCWKAARARELVRRASPTHGAAAEKELFERTDQICRSHLLQDERGDIEGLYHLRRMTEGT